MKNSIFLLVFALFSIGAQAQDNLNWTLEQSIQYALDNNITVQQAELDVANADIDSRDALGNFLPSLNARASVASNTGLNFDPTTNQASTITFLSANGSINAGYTIFDGLRNFKQAQRAKLTKIAAQYNLNQTKDDIALFVANNYLQVLLNKRNLEVIQTQNEVTKAQIQQTQELVDAGVLPEGDLLEIKAQDANEQQRIIVAQNNVEISKISLAQLLLLEDYKNFDIADYDYVILGTEILEMSPEVVVENAKEARNEIRIAEANAAIAEKDVEIARGALYPTLSAFFGYNTRYTESDPFNTFEEQLYLNDGISYGLQLNIPVLNGFSASNSVKRNKINAERAALRLEQAKLDLESNVYQAYLDAKGAAKSYDAALKAAESQELAYAYAKERYDVGLTNAFDFSQAKQRYDNAQIEVNRAKYDYIFKVKVVELYFGIPATELKF